MERPFFEQLDVIDELLAEANSEYCTDMSCPHQVLGQWHYAHKDLNREHSDMDAAQQTTPPNSGESKATNE